MKRHQRHLSTTLQSEKFLENVTLRYVLKYLRFWNESIFKTHLERQPDQAEAIQLLPLSTILMLLNPVTKEN